MKSNGMTRLLVAMLVSMSLGGCVTAPDSEDVLSPNAADPLAANFDDLAQEQSVAGDVERSEEFRWAALGVRFGLTPARFTVNNAGQNQTFDAFVEAVHWTLPTLAVRPVGHRTFIAWRKTDDAMQVIIVSSQTDVAPVLHPYSMRPTQPGGVITSPVAGASAAYFERGSSKSAWLGITGQAKIAENAVGLSGACAPPTAHAPPKGVTCSLTAFTVGFDITIARTPNANSRDVAIQALTRKITASDQTVPGVNLTFSCVLPLSDQGCK